jgi:hypothetical protein
MSVLTGTLLVRDPHAAFHRTRSAKTKVAYFLNIEKNLRAYV